MTTAVRFQALPPLSPDEYQALEQSIVANGVLVPIITDEHGVVIDGHHRQKIAAEHEIFCPRRVMRDLEDSTKRTLALSLNLDRRHLTREQRRALVSESIKADPQLSDTVHAKRTGVSDKTATVVRSELESTSEIPKLDRTIGADGKARPAAQPARPRPEPELRPDDEDALTEELIATHQRWPPLPENYMTQEEAEAIQAEDASHDAEEIREFFEENPDLPDVGTEIVDAPRPSPKKPPRPPLSESFGQAVSELTRITKRLEAASADDRFKKNADQMTHRVSDLIRARDALQRVIDKFSN